MDETTEEKKEPTVKEDGKSVKVVDVLNGLHQRLSAVENLLRDTMFQVERMRREQKTKIVSAQGVPFIKPLIKAN